MTATYPANWIPLGYQQLTSLAAATSLTVPTGATRALLLAEGQAIRWRDDGTNPTAAVGMPIAAGESIPYVGNLSKLRVIEQTASAKLNISYYG